jgi:hypothetical protein
VAQVVLAQVVQGDALEPGGERGRLEAAALDVAMTEAPADS